MLELRVLHYTIQDVGDTGAGMRCDPDAACRKIVWQRRERETKDGETSGTEAN